MARTCDGGGVERSAMTHTGGEALVGRQIAGGKYQIVRMLGEGGMGAVYQARQTAMNRMVALKLIRPEVVTRPDAVARFHKEMMVTARIEHPHTIRVYDFGEDDGQLYLVMELLTGTTLRRALEVAGRLDPARIVRIGKQVASALGAIHAHGIVHRDLKPDNVMLLDSVGEPDFVKVLDFGIAKSLDEDVQLTATGRPIGTPAYMAPEQAMGKQIDHRTDLYALGVMLYRMASGRLPFDAPTLSSMLIAHALEPPVPLLELAPDLSPALAGLVMRLLEKDPAARPATAADVAARLDRGLDDIGSLPTVAGDKLAVARRRRSGLAIALAGAVALAAAGLGYVALHRPDTARPTVSGTPAAGAARRHELDELLARTGPLAPDGCRATDLPTVTRLIDAARALADRGGRTTALTILGDNPGPSSEAWALLARAQLAADAGAAEATAAQAAAAQAVRLCPGYAVAHDLSGNALQKLGNAQAAEDAYVRALTAAPQYDAPRFNLGLLQLRQHDATAIATFTELLRRRPDHPDAYLARAQAYAMQGMAAQALGDLEEAVRRQPDSAEAWAALGELRERLGRGDAQAAYCRAKQLGHAKAAERCTR
jgi:serine/threonine-protein kinase